MTTEGRGRTATWAKVLAVFVLLVPVPLVVWFMITFPRSPGLP
ncbi:hypothetical protein ACIRPX_01145 [Streptomyces sp. NPDC101225]